MKVKSYRKIAPAKEALASTSVFLFFVCDLKPRGHCPMIYQTRVFGAVWYILGFRNAYTHAHQVAMPVGHLGALGTEVSRRQLHVKVFTTRLFLANQTRLTCLCVLFSKYLEIFIK